MEEHLKTRNVFSEQTLIPISLVVTLMGGVVALAGVFYKAQSVERRQDYVESIFEKERDQVVTRLKEIERQQIEMDKKLDRLLQQARAR